MTGIAAKFASTPGTLASPIFALENAAETGQTGGIAFRDGSLNFVELDAAANRFAHYLQTLGTAHGDRVLGMLDNSCAFLISWLGASKIGAIWVPTNTAYRGEWLAWQVADSEPSVVVADAQYAHRFKELPAHSLPVHCELVCRQEGGEPHPGWHDFAKFESEDDTRPGYRPQPADISHLMYTSGTTGHSKGCIVSHHYLCNQGRLGLLNLPRPPQDVYYTPLPLFHTAATELAVATLLSGGHAYFAERFSVSGFWDDIISTGARAAALLGSMFAMLGNAPDTPATASAYGQLKSVAGGPFPPEMQKLWKRRFGVAVTRGGTFGLTEAHYLASTLDGKERPGSCGKPTADTYDVRVVDDDDCEVSAGQVGQIVVRPQGPLVMFSGYWRNPDATLAAMRNLWFHTGDFGYLDEDGYLYFHDRGADRLRRGGENISSYELERALMHPDVVELAVHAVPSALTEDEVKVVAVLRADASLSAETYCRWAMARVPRFAVPRYIEFCSELPKSPTGKVLKTVLREQGCNAQTWDRVAAAVEITR